MAGLVVHPDTHALSPAGALVCVAPPPELLPDPLGAPSDGRLVQLSGSAHCCVVTLVLLFRTSPPPARVSGAEPHPHAAGFVCHRAFPVSSLDITATYWAGSVLLPDHKTAQLPWGHPINTRRARQQETSRATTGDVSYPEFPSSPLPECSRRG